MELQEIKELLSNPDELKNKITSEKTTAVKQEDISKQYDPKQHDIMDKTKRQDKTVQTNDGIKAVEVARLPIPMQKRIVRLAATFLCGHPIELVSQTENDAEKKFLEVIQKTWRDNKLDYKSKELTKKMMSELEAAELWYLEPAEKGYWFGTANDKTSVKGKIRMKVLSNSLGDSLYPVFNAAGDMVAFGRGFTIVINGTKTECFDIYTAESYYYFKKGASGLEERMVTAYDGKQMAIEPNRIGKIPVIYYRQDLPEWYDVQELIDRKEKLISNLADTNDYHASPTIVGVNAEIEGFAQKGEQGKIIEVKGENADIKYLGWDKSPESQKLELEVLDKEIYGMTATPNISFEQMKGLGTFSGFALKMLFQDAHMKAADHEENFGESIQRRINFIKAAMAFINTDFEKVSTLTITPKFTYFLPKNEQEIIEMLTTAVTGKIMSQKSAVGVNPLVEDADMEVEQLKEEANSASALNEQFN